MRSGSIDVALAGESAYLDGAPATPDVRMAGSPSQWSVQIGSFAKRANAHRAAAQARRAADRSAVLHTRAADNGDARQYPAVAGRFHNLDETQARSACAALFAKGRPCMAIEEGDRRAG